VDLPNLIKGSRAIAMIGCSPRPSRTSHRTLQYLLREGFEVLPVNPHHDSILGLRCYASILDIPADLPIQIVNVFRRPEFVEAIVRDVLVLRDTTGQNPAVWTQLGVSSQNAAVLARAHGIPYVPNRCIMVEHSRLG